MITNIKLDKGFTTQFNRLSDEYGPEFLSINGFAENNLNLSGFIDNFIDSENTANSTIDANANVQSKDIVNLINEVPKPYLKLLGFNKLFYEMNKKYGYARACEMLDAEWRGDIFIHNSSDISFRSYCFNYDLEQLATKGMFFIPNLKTTPAKHLSTFCDHLLEFVSWTSSRQSGATGLANALMWLFWFWKNDVENGHFLRSPEYYKEQCFQKVIFDLGMPYLRVTQCAYTNFSIYDRAYCEEMFGGFVYPDGKCFIDYVEEFIDFQKSFLNKLSKMRETNLYTYPVLTYCLVYRDGKFEDEEFARWASAHNMRWADANFLISPDTTSAASCCFDGSQMCLTRSSKGVSCVPFRELYEASENTKSGFRIFHNGSWVGGKVIKLPKRNMYKIVTTNNKELLVTDNHVFPTLNGDKTVNKLTINDYLLVNNMVLDTFAEKDMKLTYEQGFLIGMYLGDGSVYRSSPNSATINFSINSSKYANSVDILTKALSQWEIDSGVCLGKPYNNVYPVTVYSSDLVDIIKYWVGGNCSVDKTLNMDCLLQSIEFRKGILQGYYLTDGGNSNRIYSTSEELISNIECLCTSLGMHTVIDKSDRTDELVAICGKEYARNYPLYYLRWYDHKNKRNVKNLYVIRNNNTYFKIKTVEPYESVDDYVYCFEMDDADEPYFTLPNGIITHNCRLLSSISDLKSEKKQKLSGVMNSIGGTSLDIGSVTVVTLNMAGLAYQANDESKFFDLLEKKTRLIIDTNDTVRSIIKRNVEKNLLPNYSYGLMKMDRQFNTIGINGVWEAAKYFGYAKQDEFGYWDYTEEGYAFASKILDEVNRIKDSYDFDYSINIEQTPMENGAIKIAKKNQLLYKSDEYITGNQWIALKDKASIQARTKAAGVLDVKCGGGCITHIQIDAPFNSEQQAWDMLNYIAKQGVIYFAFNLRINTDGEHHSFTTKFCPICGSQPTETYQRCVGYLVPTHSWSAGRQRELGERDWMNLNDVVL